MANTNTLQITSEELRGIQEDAFQRAQSLLIAQGNRQGPGDATSGSSPGGKGWRKKGQPNRDQGQGASPGRVYRAPGNLPPTLKELQDAQNKESPIDLGQLQEEGYGDEDGITSLQIKGEMPPQINSDAWDPRQERRKQRIRDLKQGNQNPNEKKSAERKQSPRERIDIPDFLQNVNVKPQDLLKILYLIPALTGFDLQMADASALTDHLDSAGRNQRTGSFRGTPLGNDPKKLIETLLIGADKFKA